MTQQTDAVDLTSKQREAIGRKLKTLRQRNGWSQKNLAEKMREISGSSNVSDFSTRQISRAENGSEDVDIGYLHCMTNALDTTLEKILNEIGLQENTHHSADPHHNLSQPVIVGLRPAEVSPEFKGRRDKIEALHGLLKERHVKLITIVGRGGIGKTQLLAKICEEIERGERGLPSIRGEVGAVDGIIYFDGKPTVEHLFDNFSSLLYELGSQQAEEWDNYRRDTSHSLTYKIRLLLSILRDGCYLLVLDSFEKTLNADYAIADADFREFVDLCLEKPHGLRIIVTSRYQIKINAQFLESQDTVFLEGLQDVEAIMLLCSLDRNGELGLRNVPEALLAKAAHLCFGNPFALKIVVSVLTQKQHKVPTLETFLRNEQVFNQEVVENLIEYQFNNHVNDDMRSILEVLTVYNRPVSAAAVAFVLEQSLPNLDVESCLHSLIYSNLVMHRRDSDTYELHDLHRQYVYERIPDNGEGYTKQSCHRRAALFCQYTGDELQDIEWKLQAWEHWFKAGTYVEAAKRALSISRELRKRGYYRRIVDLYQATVCTPVQPSPEFLGLAIDCLGMLGRMEEQEVLLNEAMNTVDSHTRGLVLELAARFYTDRGNFKVALSSVTESLDILKGLFHHETSLQIREQLKIEITQAAQTIAWIFYSQGLYSEAVQRFSSAHDLMKEIDAEDIDRPFQYFLADSLRRIGKLAEARRIMQHRVLNKEDQDSIPPAAQMVWGQILLDEGDFEVAWSALKQAEKVAIHRRSQNALSRINWAIGKWYSLNGKPQKAIDCYQSASDYFKKWKWRPRLSMVQQEMGWVQHRLHNLASARRYYEEACAHHFPLVNYGCEVKLGLLSFEAGKIEESREHFERGIEFCQTQLTLTPGLYDALYHRGLAHLGIGQPESALADYRQALNVCPAKGVVHEAILNLELLRPASPVEGVEPIIELLVKSQ